MAQQEEPLYDFPEPTALSVQKLLGHQRGRGSLKSINVLDRLLLTVPVWLQLSINPATALHILQREPPGTFLVRKSRTSQKNVLCVRLADDSMPSFVQQFGISEENSTLCLETSAISFPDLPRLISFYCVSRDVLPFPLELPEAIAKATSHKELESISHMGIEFWSSHLNVRGPREVPKPQKDKKADTATVVLPAAVPQTSFDSAAQSHPNNQLRTVPESDTADKLPPPSPTTVFQTFCPITTRSPKELDCGSGLGALCFINPLFVQSQDPMSRRRMFQRSVKIRVSTETATLLSPPIAPPPPPPLMPKTKGRCKAQKEGQGTPQPSKEPGPCKNPSQSTQNDSTAQNTQFQLVMQTQEAPSKGQVQPSSATPHFQPQLEEQDQMDQDLTRTGFEGAEAADQLPAISEHVSDDSEYKQPSPVISSSHSPSHNMAPLLFPKVSPSRSPHNSPSVSPSLSPYQSPALSPKAPVSRSLHNSSCTSPSLSPRQSPSPSPKVPFSLSPFTSPSFPHLAHVYHTPDTHSSPDQQSLEKGPKEEGASADRHMAEDAEANDELQEKTEDDDLVLHMDASCLHNSTLCNSVTQCN